MKINFPSFFVIDYFGLFTKSFKEVMKLILDKDGDPPLVLLSSPVTTNL